MNITIDPSTIENNKIFEWIHDTGNKLNNGIITVKYQSKNQLFEELSEKENKFAFMRAIKDTTLGSILSNQEYLDYVAKEYSKINKTKTVDWLIRIIPYSEIDKEYTLYQLLELLGNKQTISTLFVSPERLDQGLVSTRSRFGSKAPYETIKKLLNKIT